MHSSFFMPNMPETQGTNALPYYSVAIQRILARGENLVRQGAEITYKLLLSWYIM